VHHRDLKLENVLLKITPTGVHVKIIDFGTSTDLERMQSLPEGNDGLPAIGSPPNNPPKDIRSADAEKLDVFQCGATLLQMLCVDSLARSKTWATSNLWKRKLYRDASSQHRVDFAAQSEATRDPMTRLPGNQPFWTFLGVAAQAQANPAANNATITTEARDFLNTLLDPDHSLRPTLQAVANHPWMQPHPDDLDGPQAVAELQRKMNGK